MDEFSLKAIILAGGRGTRLAPYTKVLPKPLMPIGDMPILEILLRQLQRAGINEVILTVGHLAQLLKAFFNDGGNLGLNIHYSYEEQPLGTAGPLSLVDGLDDTFIVTNGDVLTSLDIRDLIKAHRDSGAIATIASQRREINVDLGVLHIDGTDDVVGYTEKPIYDLQVSMGIYIFEPRVLEYIPYNQYLDFPDLVLRLLENEEMVKAYPFNGYWQDLGRSDDYEQAVKDFEGLRKQILGESG